MPAKVSAIILIIFIRGFPRFAYSARYMAAITPMGTAIASDKSVIIPVFIMAGSIDTFWLSYCHENMPLRVSPGIPLYKIYTSTKSAAAAVITADNITAVRKTAEKIFCLLFFAFIVRPPFSAWKRTSL